MTHYIPYGRQSINQSDINEVNKVLESDWLTQGPTIDAFERAIANYCKAEHCVAVSNATAALHLACLSLGLTQGDIVWTTPNSFVASANCALYCGAQVDFVDIELKHYNLCVQALADKLKQAESTGTLPKIVIPVHFAGLSCDMQAIKTLKDQYGFKIIEDASHAIGGSYLDQKVGACLYADITVFSFHPVKIITTGEGGVLLTNHNHLYQKLKRLRTHGITRSTEEMQGNTHGPWYYEQIELGFNYRLTDIQASLGLSQLQRLDQYIHRRQWLADRYDEKLSNLPLLLPKRSTQAVSSWHLYVIRLPETVKKNRLEVFNTLRSQGIGVNVHYIPIHTQPYYERLGFTPDMFPKAMHYYKAAITLPLFPTMTEGDQDRIVAALESALT